jgi:hypothetical protein
MRINKIIFLVLFSFMSISCNDNPIAVDKSESIFGIWDRVEPILDNYKQGSSGITTLELYIDSTYKAVFDTIKTTHGAFNVTKSIIPLFSLDSIYVLNLIDEKDILNNISFGIIFFNKDFMTLHRITTDSVDEFFKKSRYTE